MAEVTRNFRLSQVDVAVERWSPLWALAIWSAISALVWAGVVGMGAILF